ncbi:MAG TPA: hypothetical protein VN706_12150 [Gemmatimonadaceae bacterium]|nr:hypothetical protein [Gemmatimonadaceae bacterium]
MHFTEDSRVIDVDCPKCGKFRVEIPGYHITLDALSGAQRLEISTHIQARRKKGEASPLVTLEYLNELVSAEAPPKSPADESQRPA